MNFSKQRCPPRRSMLGTHREHNFQLLPNHPFKNAKSRLGTHCSSQCDRQLQPDSAPKSIKDNVSNKSYLTSNVKNASVRSRKSMLGTHKIRRASMLPFLPHPESSTSVDTSLFEDTSNKENEIKDDTDSICSLDIKSVSVKDNVLTTSSEQKSGLATDFQDLQHDDIMSRWSLSATNNHLYNLTNTCISASTTPFSKVHQIEDNIPYSLFTNSKSSEAEVHKEMHSLHYLKPETTCSVINNVVPTKKLDIMFSPESNDSFIELETMIANEHSMVITGTTIDQDSILATTLKDITLVDGDTSKENVDSKHWNDSYSSENDIELQKILTLMNTWIEKNTEVANSCCKQVGELQHRISTLNKEIEDIKSMKKLLIKKFNLTELEKENLPDRCESVGLVIKPVVHNLDKTSPVSSSSRQVLQELRSSIKFLKTDRKSVV